jgi:SAM-dependent methyltransferase
MTVWQWDPSLYLGSADYYAAGRMPYPSSVVWALRDTLGLDGTGRLLDVGSGPGTLTIPLAGLFAGSVAVDADADMIAAGRASAESLGLRSISWHVRRAEELPADLGRFRVITFAQSFHWMDQPTVARAVAGMLEEGGSVVHLGATTVKGTGETPRTSLHYPKPPWDEINELVRDYLGTRKRAGQGVRPTASFSTEREVFSAAGFGEPQTVEVPHNVARIRTVNEIVAAVYSLSYSAPHLFGDRKDEFEAELRELLASRSALGGLFAEQVGSVQLTFWRAPEGGFVEPPAPQEASASRKPSNRKASAAKTSAAKTAAGKRSTAKRSSAQTSSAKTSPATISSAKSSPAKTAAVKSVAVKTAAVKTAAVKTAAAGTKSTAIKSAAKSTATRRSAAKTSVPKTSVPKTSVPKTSAAKTSVPKTSVAKTSVRKTSVARTSSAQPSAAESPATNPSASQPAVPTRPKRRRATKKAVES